MLSWRPPAITPDVDLLEDPAPVLHGYPVDPADGLRLSVRLPISMTAATMTRLLVYVPSN